MGSSGDFEEGEGGSALEGLSATFFTGMSADERRLILGHVKHRHFAEGSVIVAPGDDHRELCIIKSGMASVSVVGRDGTHHVTHRLGPGSILGELSFFTGHHTSAGIRAETDVELFVLNEERFRYIAAQVPRAYANVGAIMAQKLATLYRDESQSNLQLAACLIDHGAVPLAGYALAASVAWHTHRPTLLLLVGEDQRADLPPELESLARHDPEMPVTRPCAHLARFIGNRGSVEGLEAAVDAFALRYHHILIQLPPDWPLPVVDASVICLDREKADAGPKSALYTIRFCTGQASIRPDHRGVLCVPPFTASEREELSDGLLSSRGEAGKALGWAARDLAHLKVGVALGAGSSKGFGHIGVLQVLLAAGLPIDYIAGTSIGSCIAGMYALGYSLEDMPHLLGEVGASAWSPTVSRASVLSSRRLKGRFQLITGDRRIEDLPIPTAIVAADILSHRQVVFRRGLIWQAVLASIAVPGAFPPQLIGGHLLVDGGVVNPVPSNVAADMGADTVIGVKLATHTLGTSIETRAVESIGSAPWLFHTVTRAMEIMQTRVTVASTETSTIQIDVDFSHEADPGLRRFREGQRFIAVGQAAAQLALPRIAASLPWMSAPGEGRE